MNDGDTNLAPLPDPTAPREPAPGPVALRSLAAAFAHLRDFDRFVAGLQAALDRTEWFGQVTLEVGGKAAGPEMQFAFGEMALPLQGNGEPHGLLRAAGRESFRSYGPEDLHLLAGLAEFLASVLDRAREWREVERQRRMLDFLLNQAPVGIVAFAEPEQVIAANDLARRWLGGGADLWKTLQAALPEGMTLTGAAAAGGFHLRAAGRLVFGERRVSPDGAGVVVLTDLTADQARLLDALRRETYRCKLQGRRLCFALLESRGVAGDLLRRLPALRTGLAETADAGPYDAHRVGLVLSDCARGVAAARLRRLRPVLDAEGTRAAVVELGREGEEPETLLEAALDGLRPWDLAVRPALLLHDDSAAVNDALALVLGRDFEVVSSTDSEHTRQLLRVRAFDGLITEIELRSGSGLELARWAAETQPGLRPFLTTVSEMPEAAKADPTLADAVVFQKPFDMRALARTVKDRLGA